MKRFTALLLIAVLLVSSFAFAEMTPFQAGQKLKEMGFIKGDANGDLQPEKVLTREQALVTILRLQGAESKSATKMHSFSDVPQDHWASKYIAYGFEAGIVNGIGNNAFGLGQKVTKQAYLTMLLRVLGYNGADTYDKAFELANELKIYISSEDGDSVVVDDDGVKVESADGTSVKVDENGVSIAGLDGLSVVVDNMGVNVEDEDGDSVVVNESVVKAGGVKVELTGEARFVMRGEAFVMMYNALNTKLVGSNQTLLESLKSVKNSSNVPKTSDYARAYTTATLPNFTEKADRVVVTDDSVTFVDGRGKEITVQKNPQSVVGLYPSHNILWHQAGGELIARVSTKYSEKRMPAAFKDVEIIAESTKPDNISLEKLVLLKPDLVVLGIGMGKQVAFADTIDNLNIQTIVIDNETLADYLKWVKVIANINGKPELYDEAVKNVLAPIQEMLLKVPAENNPKALMMQVNKKGTLVAYRSGTTAAGMMHDLKAINIGDKLSDQEYDKTKGVDKVTLSFEAVLQNQPDLILLKHASKTKDAKGVVAEQFADNDVWNAYTAVKNDDIYDLPPNFYHYKPMKNYKEAYEYMAKILYPEIFGEQSKTYE